MISFLKLTFFGVFNQDLLNDTQKNPIKKVRTTKREGPYCLDPRTTIELAENSFVSSR